MENPITTMLRIGDWCVNPASGQISRNGESARVEVRTMRLLVCLAQHAGEVVSIDDLLDEVWAGVTVAPDSVYQAVTSLRRLLGDDPKQPTYIETVPRLGYRMVARVGAWADASGAQNGLQNGFSAAATGDNKAVQKKPGPRISAGLVLAVGGLVCLALVVAFAVHDKFLNKNAAAAVATVSQPEKSVAVLPFLDLTDAMSEEPFADGMTEELIDKLTKIPGLRVPSPTASFYYKSKLWPRSHGAPQMTVAEIAKSLSVSYVLDGSVRKFGTRVRVDSRLVRADKGFVVWSQSYDRPYDDILMVQDEIAGEVAKALEASTGVKQGQ
jgi:transcriptional activator of cad operon